MNLKHDDAIEWQANMLRDRLKTYLADHPDFELQKMLLSGSMAKGTDLKTVSDIDVACYVFSDAAPHKVSDLIAWLASRLEKAFPNFKPEQIKRKTYSVAVNFISTGTRWTLFRSSTRARLNTGVTTGNLSPPKLAAVPDRQAGDISNTLQNISRQRLLWPQTSATRIWPKTERARIDTKLTI